MTNSIEQAWDLAKQRFAAVGVDVDAALTRLDTLPVSMHCWQGDDVTGFEDPDGVLTGGIQATGNYPGKARNATELRSDLELALALIPGPKRLNLHAIYLESDTPVARNKIEPRHFSHWVAWAKNTSWGWILTPLASLTHSALTALPCLMLIRKSASSGLNTVRRVAGFLPILVNS